MQCKKTPPQLESCNNPRRRSNSYEVPRWVGPRIAARQSAKISEVRAATSLTRLWLGQGKREDARDLLASIYNWFTEGSDTPVLKEARAVLEQIDRLSPATRR